MSANGNEVVFIGGSEKLVLSEFIWGGSKSKQAGWSRSVRALTARGRTLEYMAAGVTVLPEQDVKYCVGKLPWQRHVW
jgi:hypothetical protein